MRIVNGRAKAFSIAKSSFWVGAIMSISVGLMFYLATEKSIESDSGERFANHARNAQNVIGARIKSYTDLLRGAGSLFQSRDVLTHGQFHEYVGGLELARNFPAVDTLNFTSHVLDADRDAFEQRLRAELDVYLGRPSNFKIKPPGQRPVYSVVTFIEPPPPSAPPYGIDLMMNPYVGSTINATRDSGNLMASGTPIAAMSGPNNAYLGMRLPIYRHGVPVKNIEERRAAYVGSIGIAFNVPRLVQGVLDEMPVRHVRMTLFDSGPRLDLNGRDISARERILFDSHGSAENPTPALNVGSKVFVVTLPLDFNGRPWKTTFSVSKREMYTDFDEYMPKLAMGAGFFSSMLIYALLHTLTSSRRRAIKMAEEMTRELRDSQSKLQLSHEKLRRLAAHADQIKEGERKRIAREIHDELGQNLLALRIEADMLASRTGGKHPHLHARAGATLSQIDATIKSVRQIINDLRPNVLDLGLSAAVEWQISEFRRRTGIACELFDDHMEVGLTDHCATAFFRILQESLSNILRHAKASAVSVELKVEAGRLSMTVSDNGVGLHPGGRNKLGSFGLVGIEERVHLLGGSFTISSMADSGTTVAVSVPIDATAAPASNNLPHVPKLDSAVA
jgi:signal transduction histidine kinase